MEDWYAKVKRISPNSFQELRRVFPSADIVEGLIVFNIGGNKYRLIASIHFNTKKLFILHVMTHAEYDKNKWKPSKKK